MNREELLIFFQNTTKIWQSYIDYDFIKDINLSETQIKVVDQEEDQMIINGIAGSGKSIVLLYKFIKTLMQEKDKQRILYLTFNQVLIEDIEKRANRSPQFREYKDSHDVKICTFHSYACNLLHNIGFGNVPPVKMKLDKMEGVIDDSLRRIAAASSKYTEKNSKEYLPSLLFLIQGRIT
jgi:superfamily I DNA/RNA helicase